MAHVKEKTNFVCPVLRLGRSSALSSSTETPTVLINSKIPQEVVNFSMNLLLLDEIILSRPEFEDFCADMYTLECYITAVSHMSSKVWHAGMLKNNFKHAAQCCCYVTVCFHKATTKLGERGRAELSRAVNHKTRGVTYCVQMVWAYMDWKLGTVTDSYGCSKKGDNSIWGTVFTPEAVSQDETLRCAVCIGMEAMKIDMDRDFVSYNPFAHKNILSLYT